MRMSSDLVAILALVAWTTSSSASSFSFEERGGGARFEITSWQMHPTSDKWDGKNKICMALYACRKPGKHSWKNTCFGKPGPVLAGDVFCKNPDQLGGWGSVDTLRTMHARLFREVFRSDDRSDYAMAGFAVRDGALQTRSGTFNSPGQNPFQYYDAQGVDASQNRDVSPREAPILKYVFDAYSTGLAILSIDCGWFSCAPRAIHSWQIHGLDRRVGDSVDIVRICRTDSLAMLRHLGGGDVSRARGTSIPVSTYGESDPQFVAEIVELRESTDCAEHFPSYNAKLKLIAKSSRSDFRNEL